MSDVEATNFELEKAVIESSLSSYYDSEVGRKQSSGKTSRERGLDVGRGITSSSTGASRGVASNVASAVSSNAAAASSTSTSLSASFPLSDVASSHGSSNEPVGGLTRDEYPETVQEFVVNGFELPKVIRAYELVGDNFDEMLAILMSSGV
uniref:UBA domain-containing protein n=2 Tax=Proboscia inermis TaxID=420281 RepID=A0A7S0CIQ0_9STRA|mmetsp:Transcript_4925/g.5107  ORF Transcript_4925/g.5107 Transcript_4925/m.5107 type:complete len:151 (+) Transcript_4925:937-1389(+)